VAALLDAQALIAFATAEPAGPRVKEILHTQKSATTATNLGEVIQAILRRGAGEAALRTILEPLGLAIVPIDSALAWRAGLLRARYYHRRSSRVSLADCCLVAAATSEDAVVTADRALSAMARAEGVGVVEL
jgi:PIN domain nuclease of toxin-antitoxin system